MKKIDLTLPLYSGMPVYPGDPKLVIEQIQTQKKDGWNMLRIHMNTHDGTHVNVPLHSKTGGRSLDDYRLEDFCGDCILYKDIEGIDQDKGVIFSEQNITMEIAEKIIRKNPRFVGMSAEFQIDEEVERFLLNSGMILFENLANTAHLPESFFFSGMPLRIAKGDGSPVRAYALY